METISHIQQKLLGLGFATSVLDNYNQPYRFYHNLSHLTEVINNLGAVQTMDTALFLAAVYHDAVYFPEAGDNEEKSAQLFERDAKGKIADELIGEVKQMILDTREHVASSSKSKLLIIADLAIFDQPLSRQIEYEHQIFKEYQFADYRLYLPKRLEALKRFNSNGKLDVLINYVEQRKPLIGVFCGSFNPFHRGHYNVLQKAERIFDKVIIAFGKNPDKNQRTWDVPVTIKNRQIEEYHGLLTDFIASLEYDVVVIRGLRNSTDFQYEQNQYRYIQELMPGIKIINIFCDKEFEHISSSGIRTLEKFNKHQNYLLD